MNEREIFTNALDMADAVARKAYLNKACGQDSELRTRVESLLATHDDAGSFLETPLMEPPSTRADETPGEMGTVSSRVEHERTELYDPFGPIPLDFLEPTDSPDRLGLLGSYEVIEVVGRGGMGVVLKAHDPYLDRIVAIKTLAPEYANNAVARKRFAREAQAAAAVVHPHVVTIHGVEPNGPIPYFVMEYVRGQSLREKIEAEGALELREVLRIGSQIAQGMSAAHEQGLIHRDVKPGNVLLENGVERVKLTDFGLARATDDVAITRTGDIAGTPQYMSPEQAEGRRVDARSDLFSLGSVMYAMCTGRPPFRGDSAVAILRKVCDTEPRPIREVNADIPEWLVDVIDHLLAKDPEHRFQSAEEVARILGEQLAELQNPSPSGNAPRFERRLPPTHRRNPVRWLAASVAVLAVCVAVGLSEATGVTEFTPTIVRFFTGSGTLVVEVDDPTVSVSLEGADLVITGAGAKEIRVDAGQHVLVAMRDGKPVSREIVQIARGGRQIVRISAETAPASERVTERVPEPKREPETPDGPQRIVVAVRDGANGLEFEFDGHTVPAGELEGRLQEMLGKESGRPFTLAVRPDQRLRLTAAEQARIVESLKSRFGSRLIGSSWINIEQAKVKRRNALKRIAFAFHEHQDAHKSYPPAAASIQSKMFDDEGRPYLSWRVHLLPFLDEDELYNRFHLDEPWDSDHNKALLAEMPEVYRTTEDGTKTTFEMVVGKGTAYEGLAGLRIMDIRDGTSNQALVVDAGWEKAVPWTKPADLPFDSEDPIRAFGSPDFGNEFHATMADGSVKSFPYDAAPESLRALFTRAGRDLYDPRAKRVTPPGNRADEASE